MLGSFATPAIGRAELGRRSAAGSQAPASERRAVEAELQRIAQVLNPADPESVDRARIQTVRVLLQRELGVGVREYPEWSSLVDRVARALQAAPEVDARLIKWLQSLAGPTAKPSAKGP